ncbi:MAG: hypothetical protein ACLTSX_03975 [Collinsella sp.]
MALLNRAVRGKRLLAQAPLGRFAALASQVLVLALLAVGSIALIALPAFLAPMVVNGMGEASYPVVNVLGQDEVAVIESSVGQIVPCALAMLVLAALFATLLAHAVFSPDAAARHVVGTGCGGDPARYSHGRGLYPHGVAVPGHGQRGPRPRSARAV